MAQQRYTDPRARERMAAGKCPECGEDPGAHTGWGRRGCSLRDDGVAHRIAQYREDVAGQLWATLSPEEKQSFIAGSYTEEKATEWLARVGQPPVPQGLYEAFDTRSHWEPIADAMVQIRLAEIPGKD